MTAPQLILAYFLSGVVSFTLFYFLFKPRHKPISQRDIISHQRVCLLLGLLGPFALFMGIVMVFGIAVTAVLTVIWRWMTAEDHRS